MLCPMMMNPQQLDLLSYQRPPPHDPRLRYRPRFGVVGGASTTHCSVSVLGPGIEPLGVRRLQRMLEAVPTEHEVMLQVHPSVCAPRFRQGVGYVARGGQVNPHFLDARYFLQEIWRPARRALGRRLKLLVFTFPDYLGAAGIGRKAFAERLSAFLAQLPSAVPVAIEIRDPYHLGLDYARALARFGASHVYSCAPGMPSFLAQRRWVPSSRRLVFRLQTALNGQYSSVQRRREAVVARVLHESSRPAYVLHEAGAEVPAALRSIQDALLPGKAMQARLS